MSTIQPFMLDIFAAIGAISIWALYRRQGSVTQTEILRAQRRTRYIWSARIFEVVGAALGLVYAYVRIGIETRFDLLLLAVLAFLGYALGTQAHTIAAGQYEAETTD